MHIPGMRPIKDLPAFSQSRRETHRPLVPSSQNFQVDIPRTATETTHAAATAVTEKSETERKSGNGNVSLGLGTTTLVQNKEGEKECCGGVKGHGGGMEGRGEWERFWGDNPLDRGRERSSVSILRPPFISRH